MKKLIIGTIFGFILATAASANAEGVTKLIDQVVQGVFPVTVEGTSIGEAVVIDNKTYLPVREFGEAVGYTVSFTEAREVVLTKNAGPGPVSPTPTEPVTSPDNSAAEKRASHILELGDEINALYPLIDDLNLKLSPYEINSILIDGKIGKKPVDAFYTENAAKRDELQNKLDNLKQQQAAAIKEHNDIVNKK